MTKRLWLFAASPTVALLVLVLIDIVPVQWGVIYVALAFLQGAFLLRVLKRVRSSAPNHETEQSTMPMWQKVILSIIAIYGLILVFFGFLTQQ
jgi:peptidoglycan/LPS O-acetylase OafA/YrhL